VPCRNHKALGTTYKKTTTHRYLELPPVKKIGAKVQYPMLRGRNLQKNGWGKKLGISSISSSDVSKHSSYNLSGSSTKKTGIGVSTVETTTNISINIRSSSRHMRRVQVNDASDLQLGHSVNVDFISSNIQNCQDINSVKHRGRKSERLKKKTHELSSLNNGSQTYCGQLKHEQNKSCEDIVVGRHGRKKVGAESKTWQVVCSSYNDWKLLTEKLSKNEKKCEAELVELLEQNFLETIKEMCLEKVSV